MNINRKTFLQSLAALLVAPKLLEGKEIVPKVEVEDLPFIPYEAYNKSATVEELGITPLNWNPYGYYVQIETGESLAIGELIAVNKDGKAVRVGVNPSTNVIGIAMDSSKDGKVIIRMS